MDNKRIVWLARSLNWEYEIFKDEDSAKKAADNLTQLAIASPFCAKDFEAITGVELAIGEYCPIQINIKNMI